MPRRFDFISPGVQLREVDESQISPVPEEDGLLLIGRAPMGPAMKPVKVNNFAEFRQVFGDPVSGRSQSKDVWRGGNYGSPMYAMYAAQAYLASGVGPVKYIRLLGEKSSDATAGGEAGWQIPGLNVNGPNQNATNNVSAYGLFIMPSSSLNSFQVGSFTGSLAAVFYVTGAGVQLIGTPTTSSQTATQPAAITPITASGRLINSISTAAAPNTFRILVDDVQHVVNFDPTDTNNYIRNKFNTNPQMIRNNANFGGTDLKYFLGETYEESVQRIVTDISGAAGKQYGLILALQSGSLTSNNWGYNLGDAQAAQTGWFISQQPQQEKLFRFIALSEGDEIQKKYRIKISDLKMGTAEEPSSFSVSVINSAGQAEELYTGCTLDPGRSDYISRKIGDQRPEWDSTEKRFSNRGLHPLRGNLIRVEVSSKVENKTLASALSLPVGFYGPLRPKGFSIMSGSGLIRPFGLALGDTSPARELNTVVTGGLQMPGSDAVADSFIFDELGTSLAFTGSFIYPSLKLTTQGTAPNNQPAYAHTYNFGVDHRRLAADTYQDASYNDLVRELPGGFSHFLSETAAPPAAMEYSFIFSLDDIRQNLESGLPSRRFYFQSGSFKDNVSVTARASDGLKTLFTSTISGGVRQFVAPLMGGTNGVDVFEADPFDNTNIGTNLNTSYERATLEKTLDIVADPENVSFDLLAIPGINDNDITDRMLEIAAERTDHLAIIDLDGGYVPGYDGNSGVEQAGSVSSTVNNLQNRFINNSYATAYYPAVLLGDTINDVNLYVPSSVAGIGAIAASEAASQPWFAPAGFNRGGLSPLGGPNGPQVLDTYERLTKGLRDDLYAAKINPIANFSAAGGIVAFGQKTLQLNQSALDRINVRRLMVFIKKRIGAVARNLLFDQAVDVTFNRFKGQASRILQNVKSNYGVTDFKIVLDETTTTPDLIDQNIMYAQIYIKPARAIEFIAIDFVISRSGVEFE